MRDNMSVRIVLSTILANQGGFFSGNSQTCLLAVIASVTEMVQRLKPLHGSATEAIPHQL